jgi:hypothetical protein
MALFWVLCVPPLHAQTGTDLLTDPWDAGQTALIEADLWTQSPDAGDNGAAEDTTITTGRTRTRLRLGPADLAAPPDAARPIAFGHEYTHVDFDANANANASPDVPPRLVRQELALGLPLPDQQWGRQTWRPGLVLGLGHSSTNPFGDGQAWYPVASAFAQHVLPDGAILLLGVSFDGNRSVFPDAPLPIFEYRTPLPRPAPGHGVENSGGASGGASGGGELGIKIGYPESRVIYRPNRQLTLSAGFDRLDWATAELRYDATESLGLHLAYAAFYDMFHAADDPSDRRLFFLSQRVEAGLIFSPTPDLDLTLAGGYAFGQQLRRGYDWRSTDDVLEFDDAPFVRVKLETNF